MRGGGFGILRHNPQELFAVPTLKCSSYRKGSSLARTLISLLVGVTLLVALTACVSGEESGEHNEGAETGERSEQSEGGEITEGSETGEHSEQSESGEHSRNGEGGEHDGESESGEGDGEESATQYGLADTYDVVRRGAHLILSYDESWNTFRGTVENTTTETLRSVRVEVHLSNGIELGPTTPLDLAPGQMAEITLPASKQRFETWSAHPEVG